MLTFSDPLIEIAIIAVAAVVMCGAFWLLDSWRIARVRRKANSVRNEMRLSQSRERGGVM